MSPGWTWARRTPAVSRDAHARWHPPRGAVSCRTMPVENWSDTVMLVRLGGEPGFSDDLQLVEDQLATRKLDAVLDFSAVKFINSSNIARLITLRKAIATIQMA